MKPRHSLLPLTFSICLTIHPASIRAAGLTASDGAAPDLFGRSVSQSGSIGLVGAWGDDIGANSNQGSAYVFRSLDTATGTITQNVKLTASDGGFDDRFGFSVSQSGSIGLVGAYTDDISVLDQGSAYVFRSLDTATGTITQNVKLTASDGAGGDLFGWSVSQSGSIGLVGAWGDNVGAISDQGSAYVFRNLDTATGTVTQNVKLTASDGATNDGFGYSVSQSGSIGLVGAYTADIGFSNQGSAYVFRSLNTATGTITQNVKLTASDGAANDNFGISVSQSGSIGLVGAIFGDGAISNQGSAYVFRSLDTATGTITQNLKLTASDGAAGDQFGVSVSLSGSIGLVGAYEHDVGFYVDDEDGYIFGGNEGSAYVFRNLDTATGTITQNVKLTASDGWLGDRFGVSVGLDGDQFIIGTESKNLGTGKAYSGSVASVTTLDTGDTSKTISQISFVSQDDWIIGQTTDANQVTLSAGDTANVTASGKAVFIGKNAGSDNNALIVAGSLTANQITIGAAGNTGNTLQIGTGGSTGTLSAASVINNNGRLIFNRSGTITQGTDFGSAAITGTGSVTQSGPGTTVFNAANSYTGGTIVKAGTLSIGAGGSISHSAADTIIGDTNGDNGALTITGGSVSSNIGYIGRNTGSAGTVTVTSGSWSNNFLAVGYSGTGTMNINGGTVSNSGGTIGDGAAAGNGSVTVSSGTWNNASYLHVGNWTTGQLTINGGTVTSGNGYIGTNAGANGTATVSAGSWDNYFDLSIGVSGTGALNVSGGSVTNRVGLLGVNSGSSGTATVSGGTWSSAGAVIIGHEGSGDLSIIGGNVTASNAYFGFTSGSNGTASISGGTLTTSGWGTIGRYGSGALNITGSGVVTVNSGIGGFELAANTGSTGTLNIGTGGAAGTLNAAEVNGGSGTATVNFNHTGSLAFAPQLTGSLSVNKTGSGTTTLTGTNTYTGATTVSQGKLVVNGSTSTSITTVNSGGTLGGSGTVGAVNVMSGGTLAPGNSIESLATGNLTLNGGSTFAHEINKDAAAGAAGDLTAVTGTLTLSLLNDTNLVLAELGTGSWNYGEKLTLISYSGAWNGGLFKLDGSTLADDSTFNFSGIDWKFNYNDAVAGSNWTGDLTGSSFITMTAVPEPGTYTLLGFALGALLVRRKRG